MSVEPKDQAPAARRRFLKKAATGTAAAGALAAPMIATAQTTSLRFQSTWPSKDIFHEYAQDFAKKVNDMAGGRLKIEVLPAGSVVPAFQLLDAVAKGTLDGGHGVVAYHYGKNSALALWGSGPSFGMDPNMLLAWHNYGGGKALLEEIYASLNLDVASYLYGPMPTQPFGWFKKPIAKEADLKGVKFRTVGLAVDMYTDMGAAVNPLPGGEIVPALDRGLIDGAEFNNASSDKLLGFPDVVKNCMLQSFHQSGEQFEILFNKTKLNALPAELKAIVEYGVQAASADMSWKAIERNSKDYEELKKAGVKFYKTPDAILRAQLAAWDKIMTKKGGENAMFKKILDSQRAFAARAGQWQGDYTVDFKMAYNHYFGRKAPAKKA
ncbi:TRAP transporter substrate-binding protein [Paucibacter sp. O1-1]|uniref:TRAP transporter substrate-binding protein n=1 Tax=Paucibacter sp. M5-1 TaxID=3015998 RepID=UPI0021D4B206|nr:TRAP transporter substrate-binding protein [Paucibacter sp. M5-1]MCU7374065.1 TRAP transporter substrate-binding protein [Paucibacter sp. O1-1]MCZ7880374.1 TRAP transporter substrate-binding protein [Paucibacter sp. M5-1]MDA3829067.1 TRAP transporter substrate-binding protein [Paucibacter sp. O1-1]